MGGVYRRMSGRPGWVWGTALLIGVLPFALFIAALAVMALLVTVIVFTILAAVHDLFQWVGQTLGGAGGDGRKNVRVVGREA